jgi:hypothetical protein
MPFTGVGSRWLCTDALRTRCGLCKINSATPQSAHLGRNGFGAGLTVGEERSQVGERQVSDSR